MQKDSSSHHSSLYWRNALRGNTRRSGVILKYGNIWGELHVKHLNELRANNLTKWPAPDYRSYAGYAVGKYCLLFHRRFSSRTRPDRRHIALYRAYALQGLTALSYGSAHLRGHRRHWRHV